MLESTGRALALSISSTGRLVGMLVLGLTSMTTFCPVCVPFRHGTCKEMAAKLTFACNKAANRSREWSCGAVKNGVSKEIQDSEIGCPKDSQRKG